jgi:hypothetical protein
VEDMRSYAIPQVAVVNNPRNKKWGVLVDIAKTEGKPTFSHSLQPKIGTPCILHLCSITTPSKHFCLKKCDPTFLYLSMRSFQWAKDHLVWRWSHPLNHALTMQGPLDKDFLTICTTVAAGKQGAISSSTNKTSSLETGF